MIPLSLFLIIWLVLLGIYGLMALISIVQMMRFSIGGFMGYASTMIYVAGVLIALFLTAGYLITVDWSSSLDISRFFGSVPLDL